MSGRSLLLTMVVTMVAGLIGCGSNGGALAVALPYTGAPPGQGAEKGTLALYVGNHARSCAKPAGTGFACPDWYAEIALPPSLLQAGSVAKVQSLPLSTITVGQPQGDGCEGEGFPLQGDLQVIAVDDQTLRVSFADMSPANFNPDGEYDATICP